MSTVTRQPRPAIGINFQGGSRCFRRSEGSWRAPRPCRGW
jgi:hypothetical protein